MTAPAPAPVATACAVQTAGPVNRGEGRGRPFKVFAAFLRNPPGALILMGDGIEASNATPLCNADRDCSDTALAPGIAPWMELASS